MDLERLLRAFHLGLVGTPPTEIHLKLYKAHSEMKAVGFDDSSFDHAKFLAVLILALYHARRTKVVIATTRPFERQVLGELQTWAVTLFRRFKGKEEPAQALGRSYKQLVLSPRSMLQIPEPKCWVSFGLSTQDSIPEWMKSKLV